MLNGSPVRAAEVHEFWNCVWKMSKPPPPKRHSNKSLTRSPHSRLSRSASVLHLYKSCNNPCVWKELLQENRRLFVQRLQSRLFLDPWNVFLLGFKDSVNTLHLLRHLWIYMIDEQDIDGRIVQSEGRSEGLRSAAVKWLPLVDKSGMILPHTQSRGLCPFIDLLQSSFHLLSKLFQWFF